MSLKKSDPHTKCITTNSISSASGRRKSSVGNALELVTQSRRTKTQDALQSSGNQDGGKTSKVGAFGCNFIFPLGSCKNRQVF